MVFEEADVSSGRGEDGAHSEAGSCVLAVFRSRSEMLIIKSVATATPTTTEWKCFAFGQHIPSSFNDSMSIGKAAKYLVVGHAHKARAIQKDHANAMRSSHAQFGPLRGPSSQFPAMCTSMMKKTHPPAGVLWPALFVDSSFGFLFYSTRVYLTPR